jgi:hypothetical protein
MPPIATASGFTDAGAFVPDNLINGEFPALQRKGTLLSGQNLTRGTVLGKITASGKLVKSLAASEDGSEDIFAVLALDCDASAGDMDCQYYISGEFTTARLTFGAGHTAAATRAAARALSMHW